MEQNHAIDIYNSFVLIVTKFVSFHTYNSKNNLRCTFKYYTNFKASALFLKVFGTQHALKLKSG